MTGRPNILFITADQWRGDCLGAAGHEVVKTPALDALAAEGTLFARHFATCAPCSPARASLYTGLYQMNHRVVRNGAPLDARFDNLALAARRAGYAPTLFGYTDTAPDPRRHDPADPVLESYEAVLPGFDVAQILPEDDGPWLSWLGERGRTPFDGLPMQAGAEQPGEIVSTAATAFAHGESQTAFLTDAFLSWAGRQERPWFAHLSFLRPHPPFSVPAPYNAIYAPGDGPAYRRADSPAAEPDHHPALGAMRDAADLSAFLAGRSGPLAQLDARDFDRVRAIYYGMITEVDAQIGRIAAALRDSGAWQDTIVVFTSDHAEMLGDHWMLGKGGFHPEAYQIPLILRVPGQAARRVDALSSAVDVFPTLAALMGVAPRHVPDGRALVPLIHGATPEGWRDAVVWEFDYRDHDRNGRSPDACVMVCLRNARHLYVHSPCEPALLFDLDCDPGCVDNLAPYDTATRLAMAEALLAVRACAADQTLARHLVWDWARGADRAPARR